MIYSTVKTIEMATELVNAKANEMGIANSSDCELRTITVECGAGQTSAIQFIDYKSNQTVTCAFDDCEGDDDLMSDEVVVVR